MNLRLKSKREISKTLRSKIIFMFVLFAIFIGNLIYVSFFRNERQKSNNDISTETVTTQTVTGKIIILNQDEFVTPLLKEKSHLVAEGIEDFCYQNGLVESGVNAEIFFVAVSETNENELWFFVKFDSTDRIVQVLYERESSAVFTRFSEYTEEEVVNEAWLGDVPAIRDM